MVDGPKGGLFAAKGTWLTTVFAGPSEVACDDDEAAESAAEAKGGRLKRPTGGQPSAQVLKRERHNDVAAIRKISAPRAAGKGPAAAGPGRGARPSRAVFAAREGRGGRVEAGDTRRACSSASRTRSSRDPDPASSAASGGPVHPGATGGRAGPEAGLEKEAASLRA